jgi:hypothetical protein
LEESQNVARRMDPGGFVIVSLAPALETVTLHSTGAIRRRPASE